MAIGFGFSVSDLCMGLQIIKDSVDALDKKKGAAADYSALVLEIGGLEDGLEAAQELLKDDSLQNRQKAALQRALDACRQTIETFLHSVSKYQPHLKNDRSGFQSAIRKIRWRLCKQEDVEKFRKQLARQASSINMLLITFQVKGDSRSRLSENQGNAMAIPDHMRDDQLTKMLSTMSFEHRQCFMMIMQQNNDLMGTIQDMRRMLLAQENIPSQVLLQQPISLLDPFGKFAPFHLEFVESFDCFLAILKARFVHAGVKPAGLSKLVYREFTIENSKHQRPIDLGQKWEQVWQPGEQYDMRMIFNRFSCPPSTCPSCYEVDDYPEDVQIYCKNCGLEYENVQAISHTSPRWEIHLPRDDDIEVGGNGIPYLVRHPERKPELRIFRPLGAEEDEFFEGYRRVQIVSQSLSLMDMHFPTLALIEDFVSFADLVGDLGANTSPYEKEILDLGDRGQRYIHEKQNNLPAFASYAQIELVRRNLTKASKQLRREIDILIRQMCDDPTTRELIAVLKPSKSLI